MATLLEIFEGKNAVSSLLNRSDLKVAIIQRIDESELQFHSESAFKEGEEYSYRVYAKDLTFLIEEARSIGIQSLSLNLYQPVID